MGSSSTPKSNLPHEKALQDLVQQSAVDKNEGLPKPYELLEALSAVRESGDKANAAQLAHIDRVILLAGGALTLTFTALGNISPRLHEIGRSADHIIFVTTSCWLLVATLSLGLAHNALFSKLRLLLELADIALAAEARLKLQLSEIPGMNLTSVDQLGLYKASSSTKAKMIWLSRCSTFLRWGAQLSLVAAFFFLAFFIQSNIRVMLGTSH